MHDALHMRGVERFRELLEDGDDALFAEAIGILLDDVGERPALDELHHDIGAAIELTSITAFMRSRAMGVATVLP